MKLFALLLLIGATQAYEIIEGEFFLGLKPEYDSGVFASMLKREFKLDLVKVWDIGRTKIMWVSGEEADAVRASELPEVKYLSYNGWAHADQCSSTSHPGVWGIDRTDQRGQLGYNSPSDPSAVYEHGLDTGTGVTVYVTDTGIDITHSTFEGRAVWGYTADGVSGEEDGNGHGTHCAGTIGGADYGLAKDVGLSAVKVLSDFGSGPWSATQDGLNWIQRQHTAGEKTVVSMSLGGSGSQSGIEDTITAMFNEGISFAISAGNSDGDACNYTPARTPAAVTVAATDVEDVTASFTNYGSCVDLHAPGVNVLSAQPGEDEAYFSGTSMSAPHVAGAMARYLSSIGAPSTGQTVTDWILSTATVGAVTFCCNNHDESPNLLLYAPCVL